MERFTRNEQFLQNYKDSNSKRRRQIIKSCSDDNLKVFVECILNINFINLGKRELARIKPIWKILGKVIKNKERIHETKTREFFLKNSIHLKNYLKIFLPKVVQQALVCMYNT